MGCRRWWWGLVAVLCVHCAWAAPRPLHVMLTNDDGFDAAGLVAVRTALEQAGYRVTVVAPLGQQSGSGMRVTLGEIAVADHGHDTWSVDGSPADCASYGLTRLLAANPPDIVVSGANLGQNLGANTTSSGTVGAAMMAAQLGVPAIAVSVGLDLAEAKGQPTPFASTVAAYPLAGELVARILGRLAQQAHGAALMPSGSVLNLNVPARPAAAIAGVRLAPLGAHGGFRLIYPQPAGQARVLSTIEVDQAGLADKDMDTGWFARGYVTISILRADWNATAADQTRLAQLLGTLDTLRAPAASQ